MSEGNKSTERRLLQWGGGGRKGEGKLIPGWVKIPDDEVYVGFEGTKALFSHLENMFLLYI